MTESEKKKSIKPSKKGDYHVDNVIRLMNEEEHGIHISLVDSGDTHEGLPRMNIVMETDLNQETVKNIMEGLLKRYVEVEDK